MQKILSILLFASVWCLALPTVKPVTTRSLGSGVSISSQMVQSALTLQGQTLFVGQNEVLGRAERTAFQGVNPFAASASPKAQLETYHAEELFPGVTIATTVNCLQGVCAQEADGSMGALLMLGFEQIVGTGSSAATGTLQVYYRKQAVNSPKTDCDAELDLLGKLDKSEAEKYHILAASDLSMAVCYSTEKKFLSLVTVSESGGVITLTKEDLSDCWSNGTLPSSSVALTGDGKWLYYPLTIANSCELYRLNLETKEAASTGIAIGSALVNIVQVAVSSNGKFLACNDTKKGTINIFKTSDMTGKPVAAIDFAAAGEVSGLVLSRTGKYLAFLGRKTSSSPWLPYRWKVRDGGEAEKVCAELTTDCGGLNLSPDGRYLAFVTQDSTLTQGAEGTFQVCLADFGLESADMIFTPKDGTIISQVADSDKGQQLLFLAKENAAFEVLHLWNEESGMV